jgi:hypothetical protein
MAHKFDASSSGVFTMETNRYTHHMISKYDKDDLPYSLKRWADTTRNETYSFIVLLMARNKCNALKEYWSKDVLLY